VSKVPPPHKELKPQPFEFGCSMTVFPADEVEALDEHGHLLEELAAGRLKPTTAEQRHFLKVDRDEAEPRTVLERAWVRLKGRREFEREQNATRPAEPAENYDIKEIDEDRCWW
jgi:uncharacterized protein YifE (UPF0438 family)